MSIKNNGDNNINIDGDGNEINIVTNVFGLDDTRNIVFDYKLINEVLDILKESITQSFDLSTASIPPRDIEKKNEKNKMSQDYFDNYLCNHYLPFFQQIEDYFKNVNNKLRLNDYNDICETINMQYYASKNKIEKFEDFLVWCYKSYFYSKHYKQEVNKLCLVLLHYMYWHCDIGDNV